MAEFLEERLPLDIRMGVSHSNDYSVIISWTAGGAEYRQLVHPYLYVAGRSTSPSRAMIFAARVLALYHRAYGLADSGSATSTTTTAVPADAGQSRISTRRRRALRRPLPVAQGIRRWRLAAGHRTPGEDRSKPVSGTVIAAKMACPSAPGCGHHNRRLTISPAPLVGDTITAGFEFDIPARFDSAMVVSSLARCP